MKKIQGFSLCLGDFVAELMFSTALLEIRATTPSFGVIAIEDEVSTAQAATKRV